MAGRLIFGKPRVQEIVHADGRRSYTVLTADGRVHALTDGFLRGRSTGTSRTYAYLLVDHLRWLEAEGLDTHSVKLADLQRYMGALGAEFRGPFGLPWREGKRSYSDSALQATAACLKGLYLYQATKGVQIELADQLRQSRLPTKADRRRAFLGHVLTQVPANPLAPTGARRRRHPKLPPEDARERLLAAVNTARDRMVITWLADGGFRVGELCGLHLSDLHLRERAECGQCRARHVHICHREANPNLARAKTKLPWKIENGVVVGGSLRRVSPAMVHTYFEYMTSEYPKVADHGMLLVQLQGVKSGQPLAPAGVRGMIASASKRADLFLVKPHSFRHQFATDVLHAANGNALIARDAGGWASATTVENVYGHVDIDDPVLSSALESYWGESS